MNNLILIGTSHIAKESVNKVKKTIIDKKPDIVAVELDAKRFYGLMHSKVKAKFSFYSLRRVGLTGFIFALIGSWASKKLGKLVGVQPGDEMKQAIKSAKKIKTKIALIDQDIEITLARFSKEFTAKEKWRIFVDIFNGLFFKKREMEKYGIKNLDLSKVPEQELITKLIDMMRIRYPSLYKVLIHERNVYMAKKLQDLMSSNPYKTIVAVVGAGHIDGMRELLESTKYSYSSSYTYEGQEEQTVGLSNY